MEYSPGTWIFFFFFLNKTRGKREKTEKTRENCLSVPFDAFDVPEKINGRKAKVKEFFLGFF